MIASVYLSPHKHSLEAGNSLCNLRLALNSQNSFCLCLLHDGGRGVSGTHHHVRLSYGTIGETRHMYSLCAGNGAATVQHISVPAWLGVISDPGGKTH